MILSKIIKAAFLIGGIALCTGMQSCKKKDKTPDSNGTNTNSNGTLMLHFHTNIDSNEVESYSDIYTADNGRKISVSLAQLYVSGIQLIKADGSVYNVSGVNILTLMEIEEYLVGSAPAGNYKSIRFNVGLLPATNTITPAGNDSILNKPAMWFASTPQPSGYVFVNFEGKIDTTTDRNATLAQMQPFKYRIGTNANLKTVTMPDQNYSLLPNQAQFVHITIDYDKLFNGIKLNNANNLTINTVADNATPLASQISANIPLMFRYEE